MDNHTSEQRKINASIITIGDELLIGQVVDTNSAWMAQELNKIGIWMKRKVAVGDDRQEIIRALDEEAQVSDVVLITGGLGPTADDITKPVLCDYFGGKLVLNEQVLAHITHIFEKILKKPVTEVNRKQAEVPDTCTVLDNSWGTAPGMLFEKNGKLFISMPGVPMEMKGIMQHRVMDVLKERFTLPVILHQTVLLAGIGESMLADIIKDWEAALPPYIKLAYLPNYGLVRLRMTATGNDKSQLETELEERLETLKPLVKEWMVIDEDLTIQQAVGKMLKERKQTTGTAESCTGGYVAHLLTMDAGASSNFKGSIVSYDNAVKTDVLGVSSETLESVGAVSEETVTQMVKGALKVLKTDYAIATSGIMGPDGGTEKKAVGTVWIGVGNKDRIVTQLFHFRFDRLRNIELTAMNALNMLRKFINGID
ncbi:MAG: CinA family nicotinamide mononucleotide deamidase-related protein [Chitinophagaceae bacterium]